jgi:alpha-glucuronidase
MKKLALLFIVFFIVSRAFAEDGYRLWLRYDKITNAALLQQYKNNISGVQFTGTTTTLRVAKDELFKGLEGLLGKKIADQKAIADKSVLAGTPATSAIIKSLFSANELYRLGKEGFIISTKKVNNKNIIAIAANSDMGVLYGVFHFLRLLQTNQNIQQFSITSIPKIQNRILNHWDNLNRTVERGYAGFSIWDWHKLPDYIDQRYIDYARANASVGTNGTVLTNVNANALVLTKMYLEKCAALANVFRPYGIKVYLTARFSAPVEIGGLKTADPLNAEVQEWWKKKVNEIYEHIPDFGGFLVKANSEGQPGPQNYGRSHADGANMLADAIAEHGGIVMWRAFVYSNEVPDDRFKQAYNEFKPLDGQFRKNVLIQVKNGPIDFQPREPFHPLFGKMPETPLMMEFQITQEYLGQATNLVYLPTMFKEVLDADTYTKGKGSFVSKVIDGTLDDHSISCIAGVANIGNDRNWTGHPFAQANWYAFGRLAWDYELTSEQIADEWIRQTFTNNSAYISAVKKIMLSSHETLVNYMTPLGLNHIMGTGHHYGPAPWVSNAGRADWNPVYFHKADSIGIGFDRTVRGSNALAQYATEVSNQWNELKNCPDEYLLWFHHVSWNYKMPARQSGGKSGRTLWEELCYKYYSGVDSMRAIQQQWNKLEKYIDKARFEQVKMLLAIQVKEAVWWRNACLLYFQTFSQKPIPANYEQPDHTLEYYKGLRFPYAPGN